MPHVPVEERRTQLVEAAIRVISRDGVAAASTRRIAQEPGASQASLNYSFRSKEELFAAVAEHSVDLTRAAIAARAPVRGRDRAAAGGGRAAQDVPRVGGGGPRSPDRAVRAAAVGTAHAGAQRPGRPVLRDPRPGAVLDLAATPAEKGVDTARLARLVTVTTDGVALQILSCGVDAVPDPDPAVLADGLVTAAE